MARFFDPPQPKPLIAKEKIDKVFKSMRFRVFMGSFLVGCLIYWQIPALAVFTGLSAKFLAYLALIIMYLTMDRSLWSLSRRLTWFRRMPQVQQPVLWVFQAI